MKMTVRGVAGFVLLTLFVIIVAGRVFLPVTPVWVDVLVLMAAGAFFVMSRFGEVSSDTREEPDDPTKGSGG
jgi:hypothetical protein